MNKKRTAIVIILMLCLLTAGCAKSTVRVKQNNGTYRTSTHLIFQRDFVVSTGYNDVTYVWPQGKGNFSRKFNKISFEGKSINCSVVERRLTINGRQIVEFEQGDRVRITGDGKVFVNDAELKQE
jgi:intein/homing endonuclease